MTAYCISLLFLAGLSAGDIKEKKISIYSVLFFALSAICYQVLTSGFLRDEILWKEILWNEILWNKILWNKILWDLLPGSVLLFIGFLSKEAIGYGDGMCVLALGLWTGGWFTLVVVCIGIMLAGIWGAACVIKKKKEPIPFVPFLLLGMEVALVYV